MRPLADAARIEALVEELGRRATIPCRIYLVGNMLSRGLVDRARLRELFAAIEPQLYRYPAIDPAAFRARVERVAAG